MTFNDVDTYDYFKDAIVDVADEEGFDRTDYDQAKDKILDRDAEYIGVLYEDEQRDSYAEAHDVSGDMSQLDSKPPAGVKDLVDEFY